MHDKDKMLAKLHSELICDLDVDVSYSFQYQPKKVERMQSFVSHEKFNDCLQLLNARDETSLLDSILTLQTELASSRVECDLLKESVVQLHKQNEVRAEVSLMHDIGISGKTIQNMENTTEEIQAAFDTASQLQEEVHLYQAILNRLGVSCTAEAMHAIEKLQANELEMPSLQVELSEKRVRTEVLCDRIRDLEHLVSIAAREHDELEEYATRLRASIDHANAQQTLLLQFVQQIDREKCQLEENVSQQKAQHILSASEIKHSAEKKEKDRRITNFKRIGRIWLNRSLLDVWDRWIQFVENRSMIKQLHSRMKDRVRTMKIKSAFENWIYTLSQNRKSRAYAFEKATRKEYVLQKFGRAVLTRELSNFWRRWSECVHQRARWNIISIKTLNKIAIRDLSRAWRQWLEYTDQQNRSSALGKKVLQRAMNHDLSRAWRRWKANFELLSQAKNQGNYIWEKKKKTILIQAFQQLSNTAICSKWRATISSEIVKKIKKSNLLDVFCVWAEETRRTAEAKNDALSHSVKISHENISKLNAEISKNLEATQMQLIEATFVREQFEINFISKDAELRISKLQFEKLLQETDAIHQQHIFDLEKRCQELQKNIDNISIESVGRNASIRKKDAELNIIQMANADLKNAMENQRLRISDLLINLEDLQKQNFEVARESEEKISASHLKILSTLQSNREMYNQNIKLSEQVEQLMKSVDKSESVASVLQSKLAELELEYAASTQAFQLHISRYKSTLSALLSELLGKDAMVDEANLDEIAVVIRQSLDERFNEIQVNLQVLPSCRFSNYFSGFEFPH